MVHDRVNPALASDFAVHDDNLYFAGISEADEYEVWKSDGTPEGTRLVERLATKYTTSTTSHSRFMIVNDTLLMTPDSTHFGVEPWAIQLATDIGFSQTDYFVDESGDSCHLPVTIQRTGNSDFVSRVRITVEGDTADGHDSDHPDFVAPTIEVSLSPGESEKAVWVEILDDDRVEQDERIVLRLEVVGGGLTGEISQASLTIVDGSDFNRWNQSRHLSKEAPSPDLHRRRWMSRRYRG